MIIRKIRKLNKTKKQKQKQKQKQTNKTKTKNRKTKQKKWKTKQINTETKQNKNLLKWNCYILMFYLEFFFYVKLVRFKFYIEKKPC